jgi:lipopolysaccharide export system permease protein
MAIIDRYLLRRFVQTFLICFLSLIGLFIVIDLSTNFENFVSCGQKAGNVLLFIAHYYGYQTILFFERTGGTLALISAMFTVAWIQRHNEITALMAAGVSRVRVLTPIIAAVATISLLSTANRELLIPRCRTELSRRPQDPSGDRPQALESRYDGRTGVFLDGKNLLVGQNRIIEPCFRMPWQLYKHGRQWTADNAYYRPPEGNRPGGYLLDGVRQPKNLDTRPSLYLGDQRVLITPRDEPQWLKPNQAFLVSDVDFDQLTGGQNIERLSSTYELIRGLRNASLGFGAKVRVTIHSRFIQPLLDMTLLFLGLPLVVARESRNVFVAMGICMAITTVFTLVVFGSQSLGASSWLVSPALAAWLPLMLFVPVAVWLAEALWQ